MGENKEKIISWIKTTENFLSMLLLIIWIVGIVTIWNQDIQKIFLRLNILVDPFKFSLESFFQAFITLLAIVPSVSLTAATIASSNHSYKALDFYKKDKYFWSLVILYLINILIVFLFMVYSVNDARLLLSIQLTALLSLFFIIPYFRATFRNIIFEDLVDKLSKKFNVKSVIPIIHETAHSLEISKDDPSFVFADLAKSRIKKK